jgi:hypothetical protein
VKSWSSNRVLLWSGQAAPPRSGAALRDRFTRRTGQHVSAKGCIVLGPSYSLLGLDLGRILRAGEAKGRGDGIADGRSLCSAVGSIRQDRPQFGMYLKEEVPVDAVRLRRVVRDLNYQRGRGGDIKWPEHAERIVPVERLGLAVAQIGGECRASLPRNDSARA